MGEEAPGKIRGGRPMRLFHGKVPFLSGAVEHIGRQRAKEDGERTPRSRRDPSGGSKAPENMTPPALAGPKSGPYIPAKAGTSRSNPKFSEEPGSPLGLRTAEVLRSSVPGSLRKEACYG